MNHGNNDGKCSMTVCNIDVFWWMKLLVAVLAIPSLAFVITSSLPLQGMAELAVFVLACWICTYLGMRLMQHPKMK